MDSLLSCSERTECSQEIFCERVHQKGTIQEARHKTVEFLVEFPQRKNRGISRGISTESSTETKPWNFLF